MALISPAYEADCSGLVRFLAHAYTPSTENAIVMAEGITGFGDAAPDGDILEGFGVGGLGYEQFCDVVSEFADMV